MGDFEALWKAGLAEYDDREGLLPGAGKVSRGDDESALAQESVSAEPNGSGEKMAASTLKKPYLRISLKFQRVLSNFIVENQMHKIIDQLEDSNFYKGLIEAAMDAIVVIDDQMQIVLINPAAQVMFGYAGSEVFGKNINILIVHFKV